MSGKKDVKDTAIAYQNKDVASKLFGENLKNKSFAVYGLEIPKIVEVQPTNLPVIEANELRIDNLFLLEDGSLALVDYESVYADESKIKYLNYIVRILKRNMKQGLKVPKIRMIVIYTADVFRIRGTEDSGQGKWADRTYGGRTDGVDDSSIDVQNRP